MLRIVPACGLLIALCACGGGGTGPIAYAPPELPGPPTGSFVATSGTLPHPWNRHFVTTYDPAMLAIVRARPAFRGNHLEYDLRVPGHPALSLGGTLNSTPLLASGLDYAHSVGLSGDGQTLSMVDDGPFLGHQQFDGAVILSDGSQSTGSHGTAVASILVGNGIAVTGGYAPRARLHTGVMRYSEATDWLQLGRNMREAAVHGAVAVNNSWTLVSGTFFRTWTITLAGTDPAARFGPGTSGATYLSDTRAYLADGVVVFALQNDYGATSASLMAALPSAFPDLEPGWLAVLNAVPTIEEGAITAATRISAPCLETAAYCVAADGQIMAATDSGPGIYALTSGASMAAPQVAGALALLAEAFPDLKPHQLRDRLLATADNGFLTPGQITGTRVFAAGVEHDYSVEFGHGFIDLRAALLPIGATTIPLASGQRVPLAAAAIDAGVLAPGIAAALAAAPAVASDGLGGSFRVDAARLVLAAPTAGATGLAARRLAAGGAALPEAGARDLAGVRALPLSAGDGVQVALLVPDGRGQGPAGLALGLGPGGAGRGVSAGIDLLAGPGAVLGLGRADAERVQGGLVAARLAAVLPLGGWTLEAEGEAGVASGGGAGLIARVPGLGFDRIRLGLARPDSLVAGDRLGLFVRRPLAATSGTAEIALPLASPERGAISARIDAPLADPDRALDVGVEYARPFAGVRGRVSAGLVHAGGERRSGLGAVAGLRLDF